MRHIYPLPTMALLLALSQGCGAPDEVDTSSDRVDPAVQAALDRGDTEVHLFVRLSVPFDAGAYRAEGDAGDQQIRQIARVGEEVLKGLPSREVTMSRRFTYVPWVVVHGDPRLVERLLALPGVDHIQEEWRAEPALQQSTAIIGSVNANNLGYTGAGQVIAVLDSGVNKTHSMLTGAVVSEACYSTDNSLADPLCPNGTTEQVGTGAGVNCPLTVAGCDHGTYVSGIAAGYDSTLRGVAPDAGIISIQVMSRLPASMCPKDPTKPCGTIYGGDVVAGLERVYALKNTYNIAAVNMSFSGGLYSGPCQSDPAADMADSLKAYGIASIGATGNDGDKARVGAPACIPSVVSVGSTGDGSGGTTTNAVMSDSNSAPGLDLLAPGAQITSANAAGGYASSGGTSAAAPHVAGAFAVLKEKAPDATVDEILAALKGTGLPITDSANGRVTSRIDVDDALASSCHGFGAGVKWHEFFSINNEIPWTGRFNNDNKDDVVTFTRGTTGDVYVALSTGSSFGVSSLWHGFFSINNEEPRVGDFNGDGLDDIATFTRGSTADVYVALSTGSSFGTSRKWHDSFAINDEIPWVANVNGDQYDDIVTFTLGGTGDVWVALSDGTRFGPSQLWSPWFGINDEVTRTGDIDGDGYGDVLAFTQGTSADVWGGLSTGYNFGTGTLWSGDFSPGGQTPWTGDFNGDGRDDVVSFAQDYTGDVWVSLSQGDGFGDSARWHPWFAPYTELPRVGDFDGDGADDIVTFLRGTSGDVYVALSTCH